MFRGDDVGLASGAMFSGDKENARVSREKKRQFVDLLKGTLENKGLEYEYEYHRQHTVHVITIKDGENQARRSFFDGDIVSRHPREFLIAQLFGVMSELGIEFDPEDVRMVDEIIPEVKVHDGTPPPVPAVYGGPPDPVVSETVPKPDTVHEDPFDALTVPPATGYPEDPEEVTKPEIVTDNLGQTLEVTGPPVVIFDNMTIKQLRDYGRDNERIVPASITKKDEIIEYLSNEHSDGSG